MSTQVKPGYKLTEVGIIPDDWSLDKLGGIATLERGKFSARPRNDPRFFGGDFPFIQTGDITNSNGYVTTYLQTLNESGLKVSKLFPRGTLFFTIAANIGDVAFASFDSACPDSLVGITPAKTIDCMWLYQVLKSQKKIFESLATQNAQPNINLEKLRPYILAIPPHSEQRAIATALSDMDALISGLDQLIAKKRNIKQATMQQLLTGKQRLPGFCGEWQVKTLFEIAERKKELFDDGDWIESEHITNQGVRLIQTGNIGIGTFIEKDIRKYIYEKSFTSLRCKELRRGDLLLCRLADPAGRACVLPDIGEEKIVTSVDVTIFRAPTDTTDRVFLSNLFSTPEWFRAVNDRSGGTTHKRISRGALGRISIKIPPVQEQTAIATILSDMDNELTTLETRRDKALQLKKGMMQELLTGRVRLV
jgi:type I restriction enzyme S subunit